MSEFLSEQFSCTSSVTFGVGHCVFSLPRVRTSGYTRYPPIVSEVIAARFLEYKLNKNTEQLAIDDKVQLFLMITFPKVYSGATHLFGVCASLALVFEKTMKSIHENNSCMRYRLKIKISVTQFFNK